MYGFFAVSALALATFFFSSFTQDAENLIVSKRSVEANQNIVETSKLREKMATVDRKGSAVGEAEMLSMGIPIGKFIIRDENQSAQDIVYATKMFAAAREITMLNNPTCVDYANTNKVTEQECEAFMLKNMHFTTFNDDNLSFSVSEKMKDKMVSSNVDTLGQLQKNNYIKKSDAYTQKILNAITQEHSNQLKNKNYVACYRLAQKANDYSTYAAAKLAEDTSLNLIKAIDGNASLASSFSDLEKTYIVKSITSVMVKDEFKATSFAATKLIPSKINVSSELLEAEKKIASQTHLSGKIVQDSLDTNDTNTLSSDFQEAVARKINLINQYLQ